MQLKQKHELCSLSLVVFSICNRLYLSNSRAYGMVVVYLSVVCHGCIVVKC